MDFPITAPLQGAIAQLGERLNGIQEVGGSTPPGSTSIFNRLTEDRAYGSWPVGLFTGH
jgi:hypothetical protein